MPCGSSIWLYFVQTEKKTTAKIANKVGNNQRHSRSNQNDSGSGSSGFRKSCLRFFNRLCLCCAIDSSGRLLRFWQHRNWYAAWKFVPFPRPSLQRFFRFLVLETLSTDVRVSWLTVVPAGGRLLGNHQHEHRSRCRLGRMGSILPSFRKRWDCLRSVLEMF